MSTIMKCKYADKCGSCQYAGKTYEEQLQEKQKIVDKLIKPFGRVMPIVGMESPYNYRNKVHAVVSGDRHGNILTGVYEERTHKVVSVDSCYLDNVKADAIILTIRNLMKSFKYRPYNEDTHRGFLRHILIRTAHITGQILVTLVVGDNTFPSKNNFVKALLKEHPEITSIVVNLNDRNTSMILGEREQVIYGKGYIEDELCGKRFKISSKSFYQVNSVQTEVLYSKAIEYAGLKGDERILDAYSGIGTIGIIASDHVKEVVGVESNKSAVNDAGVNLKLNSCRNVKYVLKDAGEFMLEEAAAKSKYDVVFMDPPRAGSDSKFINSVAKLAPEKVVYISCNPETLARDLVLFKKKGYKMVKCTPVDMFPWTGSVETVVLLSLKNGQPKLEVTMEVDSESNYTPEERATYQKIKEYVKGKYGVNVHTSYIAQVKRMCGLDMGENYNKSKKENPEVKQCPQEKVEYIKDALKHFGLL